MYFGQLLGAAQTQKLVETFFSAVFHPFLFISYLFHAWNQQKTSENEQKKTWFCLLLKVDMQKLVDSLGGTSKLSFFGWFSVQWAAVCSPRSGLFSWLLCISLRTMLAGQNQKKIEKLVLTPEKIILSSGRCAEHPFAGRNTQQLATYITIATNISCYKIKIETDINFNKKR